MITVVVQEDQLELAVEQAQDVTLEVGDESAAGFYALSAKNSELAADADATATAADRVQTGLDRVATGEDAVATEADRVQTGLDRVATGEDAVATDADRVQTGLDRVATGEDAVATDADRVQTGLDRVATGQDAIATAADRVQTGLDAIATAADRVQTGLDAVATDADRVQTGLDRVATGEDAVATGADRVQTGLDRVATGEDAVAAAASLTDFQGRYYGPLASDPATDPNGDPPTTGDLYWSTAQNVLKVYDGAVWQLATTTVEGVYDVTELTNVATQDTFAFTYDAGLLQVLYNGVQLAQSDFTAVNGTSVTLASAVTSATDVITFIRWGAVTESTFLGTAATEDVTTTPTDTTAGRLLKVGDFGVGKLDRRDQVADFHADANLSGGLFNFQQSGGVTLNAPGSSDAFGSALVLKRDSLQSAVLAFDHFSGALYTKSRASGGLQTPWREVYHQGRIRGIVSQDAGVPTGAIIERGSNAANGGYVRYADGTQICWNRLDVTWAANTSGSKLWSFPAAFNTTERNPIAVASLGTAAAHTQNGCTGSAIGSGVTVYAGGSVAGTSLWVYVYAIGRWF